MKFASRLAVLALAALLVGWSLPASAQSDAPPPPNLPPPQRAPDPDYYAPDELVSSGQRFFGNVSRGLASVIERAVAQWGLPNGYVLGEEGSGAFVAGLRYGEGTLYTKNAGADQVARSGLLKLKELTNARLCVDGGRDVDAGDAERGPSFYFNCFSAL